MAEQATGRGERLVVHGHIKGVRRKVGTEGSADLHSTQGAPRARAPAVPLDELTECHAEGELDDAAASDVARELEDLGAARALHAECLIRRGAVGDDPGHRSEGEDVVDQGRLAKETLECGDRRLRSDHAALALEALEHRGFLAADIGAGTLDNADVEGTTGAHDVGPEPAIDVRDVDGGAQDGDGIGVLGAHVDEALRRSRGEAGDSHAFEQCEGVALHEHAVGEGAAVALIGVAADVLLVALGFEHRAPLDASGEAGSPAATQTRGEDVGDNLLLRDRDSAGETAQAAVGAVVVEVKWIDDADAGEGHALLRGEPVDLVDEAQGQGVVGALGEAGVQEARDVAQGHGAVAHATGCGLHLDERLKPEHAARAVAHDLGVDPAVEQASLDRGSDLIGTDGAGGTVTRHEDANHARTSCARATASRMRSTSQRPMSRPSTMAAGPRAQLPRQ